VQAEDVGAHATARLGTLFGWPYHSTHHARAVEGVKPFRTAHMRGFDFCKPLPFGEIDFGDPLMDSGVAAESCP
jgi:hypothetical protein